MLLYVWSWKDNIWIAGYCSEGELRSVVQVDLTMLDTYLDVQ